MKWRRRDIAAESCKLPVWWLASPSRRCFEILSIRSSLMPWASWWMCGNHQLQASWWTKKSSVVTGGSTVAPCHPGVSTLLHRIGRSLRKRATAVRRPLIWDSNWNLLSDSGDERWNLTTFLTFLKHMPRQAELPNSPGTVQTLLGDLVLGDSLDLGIAQSLWCLLTTYLLLFRMLPKRRHLGVQQQSQFNALKRNVAFWILFLSFLSFKFHEA